MRGEIRVKAVDECRHWGGLKGGGGGRDKRGREWKLKGVCVAQKAVKG